LPSFVDSTPLFNNLTPSKTTQRDEMGLITEGDSMPIKKIQIGKTKDLKILPEITCR
jgi:hypothetical protein